MNYHHAYHAGNHTEVFKHSVLVAILEHLRLKPTPFMVLDTHAGIGTYDLHSMEAIKTQEADFGVRKVIDSQSSSLQNYLNIIRQVNFQKILVYPGSPEITRRLLRGNDRLIACELHPSDASLLKMNFRDDRRVSIHHRDGYEAVRAFCPPPERRGLVFMDPPFERTDEAEQLIRALAEGIHKWPTGIFAVWFPIKGRQLAATIAEQVTRKKIHPSIIAQFSPFEERDGFLSGSGMVVYNPPWKLDSKIESICSELIPLLGDKNGKWSVEWVAKD